MNKPRTLCRLLAMCLTVALLGGCAAISAAPAAQPHATAPQATAAPDAIQTLFEGMTLREQVGQLFVVRPDALDAAQTQQTINDADAEGVTALNEDMLTYWQRYPVGGFVFFGKNITDPAQLTAFTAALTAQRPGGAGVLLGIDEEGGAVARLANHPAFTLPQFTSAGSVGAGGDPADAQSMAQTIGGYLRGYGFQLDFAPVADVNTNPANPVIGSRAFSDEPQTAAQMVAAAVQGFHDVGVACTLKHFPGHGDTAADTHTGGAVAEKTWAQLESCEMLPFAAGIDAGADLVMAAHITTPNASSDGLPASLSAQWLRERLRGELGFTGVIITDSLAMDAITDLYDPAQAAVLAVQAGADLLLMPNGLAAAFDAVEAAVQSGEITQQQLQQSVCRVLRLKQQYGLL